MSILVGLVLIGFLIYVVFRAAAHSKSTLRGQVLVRPPRVTVSVDTGSEMEVQFPSSTRHPVDPAKLARAADQLWVPPGSGAKVANRLISGGMVYVGPSLLPVGVVGHYSFYAAFITPDEYRLVAGNKTLGTMPITQPLAPKSRLIFAGRRWEVRRIDEMARVIELAHAPDGRAPRFEGGGFDVHNRVRAEMQRIYASSTVPVYLDATAKKLLNEGRDTFGRWELSQRRMVDREGSVFLFPWCGDRVLHTLALQLNALKLSAWIEGIAIGVRDTEPNRVAEALDKIAHGAVASGSTLAALAGNQIEEKYDWALTPELRSADYASRHFEEPGACDAAREILARTPHSNELVRTVDGVPRRGRTLGG